MPRLLLAPPAEEAAAAAAPLPVGPWREAAAAPRPLPEAPGGGGGSSAPSPQAVGWALFFIAIGGEIGMLVALLYGMAKHESTIVVATYYISMTLFASIQGLCVFDLLPQLDALSASGFTFGVLLCLAGVVWMAGLRAKDGRGSSAGSRRGSGVGGIDRSALIDGAPCVVEEVHVSGAASGEVGNPAIAASQNARPEPVQPPPSSEPPQMHSCEVG